MRKLRVNTKQKHVPVIRNKLFVTAVFNAHFFSKTSRSFIVTVAPLHASQLNIETKCKMIFYMQLNIKGHLTFFNYIQLNIKYHLTCLYSIEHDISSYIFYIHLNSFVVSAYVYDVTAMPRCGPHPGYSLFCLPLTKHEFLVSTC